MRDGCKVCVESCMVLNGSHYMSLEVCWDSLWIVSFGLLQFHGHGSWVMCEMALGATPHTKLKVVDHFNVKTLIG